MVSVAGQNDSELVRLVASLEQGSEHPLGAAIVAAAKENALALASVAEFQSLTGSGVSGKVDGKTVIAGNEKLFQSLGLSLGSLQLEADELRRKGQTVIFAAVDGRLSGIIGIADPIKPSTPQAIRDLRAEGLRIVMLTGDSRTTAEGGGPEAWHRRVRSRSLAGQKIRGCSALAERRPDRCDGRRWHQRRARPGAG